MLLHFDNLKRIEAEINRHRKVFAILLYAAFTVSAVIFGYWRYSELLNTNYQSMQSVINTRFSIVDGYLSERESDARFILNLVKDHTISHKYTSIPQTKNDLALMQIISSELFDSYHYERIAFLGANLQPLASYGMRDGEAISQPLNIENGSFNKSGIQWLTPLVTDDRSIVMRLIFSDHRKSEAQVTPVSGIYLEHTGNQVLQGAISSFMNKGQKNHIALLYKQGERLYKISYDSRWHIEGFPQSSNPFLDQPIELKAWEALQRERLTGFDNSGHDSIGQALEIPGRSMKLIVHVQKRDLILEVIRNVVVYLLVGIGFGGLSHFYMNRREKRVQKQKIEDLDFQNYIFKSSLDGYLRLDLGKNIISCNENLTRLFVHYSSTEIARIFSDYLALLDNPIELQPGVTIHKDWVIEESPGYLLSLHCRIVFFHSGSHAGYHWFITDRTQDQYRLKAVTRQNAFHQLVSRLSKKVFEISDEQALYQWACESALEIGEIELVWAGVPDDSKEILAVRAGAGKALPYISELNLYLDESKSESHGPTVNCFKTGMTVVVDDFLNDPRTTPWHSAAREFGINSSISLPILGEGGPVAVLVMYSSEKFYFDSQLTGLLQEYCFLLKMTILRIQSDEKLRAERVLREASDRASELKSDFIAAISHELRTPLTSVVGYAELLRDTAQGEEEREYADIIVQSGGHLRDVVNTILDLSKIESGKLALDIRANDFFVTLNDVFHMYQGMADKKGLSLKSQIEDGVPDRFLFDRMRLVQVLSNLLHNAIKFTDSGEIVLGARYAAGSVTITVTDSGSGIAEEDIPRIFERFTQIESFNTRHHSGSGLGLALCRDLIALMGSSIAVQSVPGQGSTFSFSLRTDVVLS